MNNFDSTKTAKTINFPTTRRYGSFFGPFNEGDSSKISENSTMFFVSLVNPMEFDVEKYEYEEDESSIDVGHIFGLFPEEEIESGNFREGIAKSHYRIKRNLGSTLKSIKFDKAKSEGKIVLEYEDGDPFNGSRCTTKINLICDSSITESKLEYSPINSNNMSMI